MKKILTALLSLLVVTLTLNGLVAQEAESPREVRIMMKKNVNGVETMVDTTITLQPGQSPQEALESIGMDLPGVNEGRQMRIRIDDDNADNHFEFHEKMDGEVDVNVEKNEDGTMKVTIIRNGETQVINGADDGTWTVDDGTVIDMQALEGAGIFIGDDTRLKILHIDEDQNLRIEADRQTGNHQDETNEIDLGEENTWLEEGAEVKIIQFHDVEVSEETLLDLDKRIVMIQKDDLTEEQQNLLDAAMNSDNPEDMIDQIKIMFDTEDEVQTTSEIHVVRIEIKMEDPDEEEMDMLRESGASLNNSLELDALTLYPNPSNGKFDLSFQAPEEGNLEVQVRDLQGRTVYEESASEFNGIYQNNIDISEESAGVYFLSITLNGKSTTKKMIME